MPKESADCEKIFQSSAQDYIMANNRDNRMPKTSDSNEAKVFPKYKKYI